MYGKFYKLCLKTDKGFSESWLGMRTPTQLSRSNDPPFPPPPPPKICTCFNFMDKRVIDSLVFSREYRASLMSLSTCNKTRVWLGRIRCKHLLKITMYPLCYVPNRNLSHDMTYLDPVNKHSYNNTAYKPYLRSEDPYNLV